jgi:acyl-CoA dehydrogenase
VSSTAALPVFFAEHHHRLAERLADLAPPPTDPIGAVAAMADAGLLEFVCPDEGAPEARSLCLIRERLAALSPQADSIFAVQGLGSTPLRLAGHPRAGELLAAARRGEAVFAFALTEPEAGSDVASLRCRATRQGDGWILDGEKTLISNVGIASHYTVFATTDPGAGKGGIAAFLVPAATAGLCETPMEVVCDHPIGALTLAGVELDQSALIGAVGGGLRLALGTLDRFRVTVAAAALGMSSRAFELAFAHARGRQQFGGPLADKPMIQAQLADMATEIEAARLLVYRAAAALDAGERATLAVAQAKLWVTEAAQRIVDRAVQIHGGRGVTRGEEIEALYRAVRPLRIYEGASEIQQLIIYRELSGPTR